MTYRRATVFSSVRNLIGQWQRKRLPRNPHLDLARQMHQHAYDLARQIETLRELSPEQRSALHTTVLRISQWADRIAPEDAVQDCDLPGYEDGWFGSASPVQ